jgi:hypothetical protein
VLQKFSSVNPISTPQAISQASPRLNPPLSPASPTVTAIPTIADLIYPMLPPSITIISSPANTAITTTTTTTTTATITVIILILIIIILLLLIIIIIACKPTSP